MSRKCIHPIEARARPIQTTPLLGNCDGRATAENKNKNEEWNSLLNPSLITSGWTVETYIYIDYHLDESTTVVNPMAHRRPIALTISLRALTHTSHTSHTVEYALAVCLFFIRARRAIESVITSNGIIFPCSISLSLCSIIRSLYMPPIAIGLLRTTSFGSSACRIELSHWNCIAIYTKWILAYFAAQPEMRVFYVYLLMFVSHCIQSSACCFIQFCFLIIFFRFVC